MTKRERKKTGAATVARRRGQENAEKTGRVVQMRVGANDNSKGEEKSGLEWLYLKRKISMRQAHAGRRYGRDYRVCATNGVEPIRSHLDDSVGGNGEGVPGFSYAEQDIFAIEHLRLAREALSGHAGMVEICDQICGLQRRPREITTVQREQERLETTLSIALDLLDKHYGLIRSLTA